MSKGCIVLADLFESLSMMKVRASVRIALVFVVGVMFCLSLSGCGRNRSEFVEDGPDGTKAELGSIEQIVGREELILRLTPTLAGLNQSVLNLQLPDYRARELFADSVEVQDVIFPSEDWKGRSRQTKPILFSVSPATTSSNDLLSLWSSLLEEIRYFETAKFAIVDGRFVDGQLDKFETDLSFRGRARLRDSVWAAVSAKIQVEWRRDPRAAAEGRWRIAGWQLKDLSLSRREELYFEDQIASAIPDRNTLRRLRESKHWEYATRHYYPQRRASLPGGVADDRFFPISTAHHPGVAVVDIDQDGFDDLYITVRWGKNLLLRNSGDGTFVEVARDYGLDVEGRSNAAVFVDFDNDGDKDVMIARSLDRSMYLVNEDGKFVDRSSLVACELPFEATSVCAADYNNDGLIDVYFSTYHQDDVSNRIDADLSNDDHRIHNYLTDAQSAELKDRHRSENRSFINQIGPPNLLLINLGDGRFDVAPHSEPLMGWRNSFQASWSDYDQDGDVDLYVANDFAPDHLFRNDGAEGWRDIAGEVGIDQLGFAMGVTWGDYDNDGRDDLYVSNMYSKAGRRITRLVDGIDPRISRLATGNYLFHQESDRFQLVSGLEAPALPVARAGWAWGGQFVDFDNDGLLDLYVASGYYTAPQEFETTVDL